MTKQALLAHTLAQSVAFTFGPPCTAWFCTHWSITASSWTLTVQKHCSCVRYTPL